MKKTHLYVVEQVWAPSPKQSVRPLSVLKLPPSLCPNSTTTQSPFLAEAATAANLPSLVKLLALRPATAELLTVRPVPEKEYLRYSPHPCVPDPPPPEAMVLSPQRWIVPAVVLAGVEEEEEAAAFVVGEGEEGDEQEVEGRHWL